MAKLVTVKKREVEVPKSLVKQWHSSFLGSIGDSIRDFRQKLQEYDKAGTVRLTLDGTFYDPWYEQGLDITSFSLYNEEIDGSRVTGDVKLVQWINAVRLEIAKRK